VTIRVCAIRARPASHGGPHDQAAGPRGGRERLLTDWPTDALASVSRGGRDPAPAAPPGAVGLAEGTRPQPTAERTAQLSPGLGGTLKSGRGRPRRASAGHPERRRGPRDFVLSSGQRASWYVDLRRVLLAGRFAPMAGRVLLAATADLSYEAWAVSHGSGSGRGRDDARGRAGRRLLDAFVVRKERRRTGCSGGSRAPTSPGGACSQWRTPRRRGLGADGRGRPTGGGGRSGRGRRAGRPRRRGTHYRSRPAVPGSLCPGRSGRLTARPGPAALSSERPVQREAAHDEQHDEDDNALPTATKRPVP